MPRSDVLFVEAQGDYARLHTATESHLVRVPLTTLADQWHDAGFVRIHRSSLVALGHITEWRTEGGRTTVVVGGHELVVSRRHTRALRDLLVRRAQPLGRGGVMTPHDAPRAARGSGSRARARPPRAPGTSRSPPRSTSRRASGRSTSPRSCAASSVWRSAVLLVLAATLGLLPLLFRAVPGVAEVDVLGVPLPWVLLTAVAFTEIIALGWFYVRQSERNEDDFSDLLDGR